MKVSRRELAKALALAGATLPLAGCELVISGLTRRLGQAIPDSISVAAGAEIDPVFHLLSRAAYGPWPGDLDRVRSMGIQEWIEEQLDSESIDDTLCDLRARRFETLHHDPGTCYEYKKPVLRDEITRHTLLRAVYSKRQLFEVMVGFWSDHLNINLERRASGVGDRSVCARPGSVRRRPQSISRESDHDRRDRVWASHLRE
jgi:hypothetical protein